MCLCLCIVCMSVCVHTSVWVSVCVCGCASPCMSVYVHMCMCMHVSLRLCVHECVLMQVHAFFGIYARNNRQYSLHFNQSAYAFLFNFSNGLPHSQHEANTEKTWNSIANQFLKKPRITAPLYRANGKFLRMRDETDPGDCKHFDSQISAPVECFPLIQLRFGCRVNDSICWLIDVTDGWFVSSVPQKFKPNYNKSQEKYLTM